MREAADAIAGYVARGRMAYDTDQTIRDAILYQTIVLGEAAKAALTSDPDIATEFPAIDWSPMSRMRDRLTHHYWATDRDVVWATASNAVPRLRKAVQAALDSRG
jgi:uncharacterized protein with HEPN domain